MKKKLLVALSIIVGIVLLVFIFIKFPFSDVINLILKVPLSLLIIYIAISGLIMISMVWRWQIILRSRGHKVNFRSLWSYRLSGNSLSYILPGPRVGGEPLRAAMLKKHKINFTEGITSVLIDKTIEISTTGIFFVIGLLIVLANFALPEGTKYFLWILLLGCSVIIVFFYIQMLRGNDFFVKIFRALRLHKIKSFRKFEKSLVEVEGYLIKFYKHDKKYFFFTILMTAVSWILLFAEYKLATMMLGVDVGLMGLFLIFSFVGIAYLIPVPLNLGVLEVSQISVFSLLHINVVAGIAISFLIRFKDILWVVIGLINLMVYGINVSKVVEKDLETEELKIFRGKKKIVSVRIKKE